VAALLTEALEKVNQGFATFGPGRTFISKLQLIKKPTYSKVSPVAAIPHKAACFG
jgi:hypothetical protein